jgi:hypothetical protein
MGFPAAMSNVEIVVEDEPPEPQRGAILTG